MRKRFTKSIDARRRARKASAKTVIKTATKVIQDKRKNPPKHRSLYDVWEETEHFGGIDYFDDSYLEGC